MLTFVYLVLSFFHFIMSIVGLLLDQPEKMFKKSLHRRNDSGELDVFEAAKYFSGANDICGYNAANFVQKMARDQDMQCFRAGRFSLDMPMRNVISAQTLVMEKQTKEKKHKQPSSPGGRLASFLNSLFNQTSSKKKKSKSTAQSTKDDDESPGWRRKRRSSISHFRNTNSQVDSKSMYSSSSSGFRTPPPYAQTPTKSYRDLRSYSDHQHVMSLISKPNGNAKSVITQNGVHRDRNNTDLAWLDEKLSFIDEHKENYKHGNIGFPDKIQSNWADRYLSNEKEFKKFNQVDDGADSDSSSDLFELPNCDLDFYSNGLPVYETTNMDIIKRTTAISTVTR